MSDTSRTLEILLVFKDKLTAGTQKVLSGIKAFALKATAALHWISEKVFSIKTALIGLGTYLVGQFVSGTVKAVAELGRQFTNFSIITGMSVEKLSELKFIAEQNGLSMEDLVFALKGAAKNFQAFAQGGGEAKAVLGKMSEEFQAAIRAGAPMEELLPMLVDEFGKMGSAQERVFVALKLFEENGFKFIRFLTQGKESFEALRQESHRLLTTWTDLEATAGDKFIATFNRLKAAIAGVIDTGIKALLPTLTEWMEKFIGFIVDHQDTILIFFADILHGAQVAIPKLQAAVQRLAETFWALTKPIAAISKYMIESELVDAAEKVKNLEIIMHKGTRMEATRWGGLYERPITDVEQAALAHEYDLEVLRLQKANVDYSRMLAMERGEVPGIPGGIGNGLAQGEIDLRKKALEIQRAREGGGGIYGPAPAGSSAGMKGAAPGYTPPTYTPRTATNLLDTIYKMKSEWTDLYLQMERGFQALGDSLVDNVAGGFMDVIERTKNFKTAVKDMTKSVLSDLGNILIKMALMRLIGSAVGLVFGSASGAVSPTSAPGGAGTTGATWETFARGTPATRGPAICGEEGTEAVIPLPGNRHVPVELRGGGNVVNNYYFVDATDADSFNRLWQGGLSKNQDKVARVVAGRFQGAPMIRRKFS